MLPASCAFAVWLQHQLLWEYLSKKAHQAPFGYFIKLTKNYSAAKA